MFRKPSRVHIDGERIHYRYTRGRLWCSSESFAPLYIGNIESESRLIGYRIDTRHEQVELTGVAFDDFPAFVAEILALPESAELLGFARTHEAEPGTKLPG